MPYITMDRTLVWEEGGQRWPVFCDDHGTYALRWRWNTEHQRHSVLEAMPLPPPPKGVVAPSWRQREEANDASEHAAEP